MLRGLSIAGACLASTLALPAHASDACLSRAIVSHADVSVSDGSAFRTISYFHSPNAAAIRHIYDDEQLVVTEGPFAWVSRGGDGRLADRRLQNFALGHQYHAFVLYFEEMVEDPADARDISFAGQVTQGVAGANPYGGTVYLLDGVDPERPAGLLFLQEDGMRIEVALADWRELGDHVLPFTATIDDGEREFVYRYSEVVVERRTPAWFMDTIDSPGIDSLDVYRLHRRMLVAHCNGNAAAMAALSAPEAVVASRGEVYRVTPAEMEQRFTTLFERLDYTGYHDLLEPVIEVAGSGDLAWATVQVRALGRDRQSGQEFDDQWAWTMLLRNTPAGWQHAGNASNRKASP